jgi:hypothetical protein
LSFMSTRLRHILVEDARGVKENGGGELPMPKKKNPGSEGDQTRGSGALRGTAGPTNLIGLALRELS